MQNPNKVEVLVHNISHSDLILNINNKQRSLGIDQAIARPKFSQFREITENLYSLLKANLKPSSSSSSSAVEAALYDGFIHDHGQYKLLPSTKVPVGFRFLMNHMIIENTSLLRFRRDDKYLVEPSVDDHTGCIVDSVYFPLLAILLPQWLHLVEEDRDCRKVIVLISGRGTPMDNEANMIDNSTNYTAMLMRLFLAANYPDIEVVHQHSTTNLFRYDENVIFVKSRLQPLIDKYRNEVAEVHGSRWKEHMRVSIAFADGSSARISAIQAALRHYRPQYFHFWQLKTFWSESKICFDDIECHSYEVISAEPATNPTSASAEVQLVLKEMERFRADLDATMKQDNDVGGFWLRKSGKPVLAVLLVKKPGQEPKLYRGTNVEVSMPTGSLCAERNAIGTAFAADLTLKRQDLRMVAVYAYPSITPDSKASLSRNASMRDPRHHSHMFASPDKKITDMMLPDLEIDTLDLNQSIQSSMSSPSVDLSTSSGATRKIINFSSLDSNIIKPQKLNAAVNSSVATNGQQSEAQRLLNVSLLPDDVFKPFGGRSSAASRATTATRLVRSRAPSMLTLESGAPSPVNDELNGETDQDRADDNDEEWNYHVIHVDESDINPLKPCGACHEWLKKIAECNPQFTVLTFTDHDCTGIYTEQIADC